MDTFSPAMQTLQGMPHDFRSFVHQGVQKGHKLDELFLSPAVAKEGRKDDGRPENVDFHVAKKEIADYAEQCQTIIIPLHGEKRKRETDTEEGSAGTDCDRGYDPKRSADGQNQSPAKRARVGQGGVPDAVYIDQLASEGDM